MKKQNQKQKKKKPRKRSLAKKNGAVVNSNIGSLQEKTVQQKPVWNMPKKVTEKKRSTERSIPKYFNTARQFLRESRMELKKVKWPTRKELLASTAVVIVVTLIVAFFLGLVDFGLIKIIRSIVG